MKKSYTMEETLKIATYQKWVIYCVLVIIISYFITVGNRQVGLVISIILIPIQIYCIIMLASSLKFGKVSIAILAIGLFIPIISLLVLVSLSSRASAAIKNQGFHVGLMGANLEDIEKRLLENKITQR